MQVRIIRSDGYKYICVDEREVFCSLIYVMFLVYQKKKRRFFAHKIIELENELDPNSNSFVLQHMMLGLGSASSDRPNTAIGTPSYLWFSI